MTADIDTILSNTGLHLRRRGLSEGRHIDLLDAEGTIRATIRQAAGGLPRWRVLPDGEWHECQTVEHARLAAVRAVARFVSSPPEVTPLPPAPAEPVPECELPPGTVTTRKIATAVGARQARVRLAVVALKIRAVGKVALPTGGIVMVYPESAVEAVRVHFAAIDAKLNPKPRAERVVIDAETLTAQQTAKIYGRSDWYVRERFRKAGLVPVGRVNTNPDEPCVTANAFAVADIRRAMGDA